MNIATLPVLIVASLSAAAALGAEERVTRTAEGFAADHAADELRDPRTLREHRTPAAKLATRPRGDEGRVQPQVATVSFGDSWIFEASAEMFYDNDGDGYFHYLRVRFDADTVNDRSLIYAEIYLSADGEAWEFLTDTKDFTVFGTAPDDDYEVETELVSGYSTGKYDVLIELHDAADGTLLDEFGPRESAELSLLPLEDSSRDGVVPPPPPPVDDGHHGGGAMSWLALLGLAGAALARRRPAA
ncbi:MAG TPA: choice-of-anchor H family protein [Gammaproteobacteria bacterium]|nr:choice-of-anchor H family protein [Gammaproteobacteria bacterium]